MPKIAAFPKGWIHQLVAPNQMSIYEWIEMSRELEIEGLEMYSDFADLQDPTQWKKIRSAVENAGMVIPMMCCSPDFTIPDPQARRAEVDKEIAGIRMSAELGAKYCRVLSGQRRKEITREQGMGYVVESIEACLPVAEELGVTLILENHYKDGFWKYPEFAQKMDVFLDLVNSIEDRENFGVQFDPSNAIVAGDDPVELLRHVASRVVSMHASDRYLEAGANIDELRQSDGTLGYSAKLKHGVTGKGLNDFDTIFRILKENNYQGWVSIEDGMNGMEEMAESLAFLRLMSQKYFS